MPLLSRLGTEILANTSKYWWAQIEPSVARLANGGFVISWEDDRDPRSDNIEAQIFNADGSKSGSAFVVDRETSAYLAVHQTTALTDGRFVVAWLDYDIAGANGNYVTKAQILNADGSKAGSSITVATTSSAIYGPSITALNGGNFIVSWNDKAQIYSAQGAKVGTEFEIGGSNVSISPLADGGFVTAGSGYDIIVQRFDAFGQKLGGDIMANSVTTGWQMEPAVANFADGGFVVSWSDGSGLGGDSSGTGIKAQRFAADGTPIGGERLVNTSTLGDQIKPCVLALESGGFVISWLDKGQTQVRAQIFDPSGTKVGAEQLVSSAVAYDSSSAFAQSGLSMASMGGDKFIISWAQTAGISSTDWNIKAQIFSVDFSAFNYAPVITSDGGAASAALSVAEQSRDVTTMAATDANPGAVLKYAIHGGVDAALFEIDSATGALRFKTAPDFETPVDAGKNNLYDVIVRAGDGKLFDTQTLVVTVTNVDEPNPPQSVVLTGTIAFDNMQGSDGDETIKALAGDDWLFGHGGNDILIGGAGNDNIFGGTGDDIVQIGGGLGADGRLVNGSDVIADDAGFDQIVATRAGTIMGFYSVYGIEVISAGGFANVSIQGDQYDNSFNFSAVELDNITAIKLGSGQDALIGSAGPDTVFGQAGNDTINGRAGDDLLVGGAGKDMLTGGSGNDRFQFTSVADSTASARDIISDFRTADGDLLDMSLIDANKTNGSGTNERFTFIGTAAFHHVAGEIRYMVDSLGATVNADVNGDGVADFSVRLLGVSSLMGADFLL